MTASWALGQSVTLLVLLGTTQVHEISAACADLTTCSSCTTTTDTTSCQWNTETKACSVRKSIFLTPAFTISPTRFAPALPPNRKRDIITVSSECPAIIRPPIFTLDAGITLPPLNTKIPNLSIVTPSPGVFTRPPVAPTTTTTTTTTSTVNPTTTSSTTSVSTSSKISSSTAKPVVEGSEKEGVDAKDDANQAGDMATDSSAAGTDTGLVVGIVVGAVLCLLGACLVAFAVMKNRKNNAATEGNYNPESPLPAHSRPAAPLPEAAAGGMRTPVYGAAPRKSEEIGEYRYVPCDAALTDGGTIQSAGSDSTYGELHLSPRDPLPGLANAGGSFQ